MAVNVVECDNDNNRNEPNGKDSGRGAIPMAYEPGGDGLYRDPQDVSVIVFVITTIGSECTANIRKRRLSTPLHLLSYVPNNNVVNRVSGVRDVIPVRCGPKSHSHIQIFFFC